jgi:DNA repair protein RadC
MGAKAVVIAHNHASGKTSPTGADIRLTVHMIKAGRLLGIQLLDHIILAGRSWRSLRESTRIWTCD